MKTTILTRFKRPHRATNHAAVHLAAEECRSLARLAKGTASEAEGEEATRLIRSNVEARDYFFEQLLADE